MQYVTIPFLIEIHLYLQTIPELSVLFWSFRSLTLIYFIVFMLIFNMYFNKGIIFDYVIIIIIIIYGFNDMLLSLALAAVSLDF